MPPVSSRAVTLLVAAALRVAGLADTTAAFAVRGLDRRQRVIGVPVGVLMAWPAVWLIFTALLGLLSLTLATAILPIAPGAVRIGNVKTRRVPRPGWAVAGGVVSILPGVSFRTRMPQIAATLPGVVPGVDLPIGGAATLAPGIGPRRCRAARTLHSFRAAAAVGRASPDFSLAAAPQPVGSRPCRTLLPPPCPTVRPRRRCSACGAPCGWALPCAAAPAG